MDQQPFVPPSNQLAQSNYPYPAPPPFPPQKPSHLRRFYTWYRRQSRPAQIVIVSVLLVCVVAFGVLVESAPTTPVATPSEEPTSAPVELPTPTYSASTPLPTATMPPTSDTPALLGGDISNFVGMYGQPNAHSIAGQDHFQTYPDSNTDFLIVATDTPDGGTYSSLVFNITAQAPGGGWSPGEMSTTCSTFYPLDAVYQKQVALSTGNGYDKVYYSSALATTFPTSAFMDSQQNTVKPGLFDMQVLTRSNGMVDSCSLNLGTQQET